MNGSSSGMQQIRRDVYAYKKISKHMEACDSMLNQNLGGQWYHVAYKVSCEVNEITKRYAN
jgi:hypothetical protein